VKLLIAIPALNEEESIEAIIQRSLAARDYIVAHSSVTQVLITVVSDGSTDRTVDRATPYVGDIDLIVFPKNRGYGAAIKEAWARSDAELLGFLDADGTCDPEFFATLCATAESEGADVVLGCRLNKNSRMPLIRRVGNALFATMLRLVSSSRVRDTASGMRVVRRSSLGDILPLPDGLHFTPAMSARAMLSERLKIVEVDMPYHERAGESKLRIGKDGLRFLRVILEAAFLYRPSRPLDFVAAALVVVAAFLMRSPILYYLQNRSIQEWMIYRFLVSNLVGVTACLSFSASYLTGRIAEIALSGESRGGGHTWTARFFNARSFWLAPAGLFLAGGLLVLPSFLQLVSTGQTYEHWSRYVVMSFCFAVAIILSGTRVIDAILGLVAGRVEYLKMHQGTRSGASMGEKQVDDEAATFRGYAQR
jgi:glycosyltransferase involved in cell wall biosynthesis